jgi:hypothetical protein
VLVGNSTINGTASSCLPTNPNTPSTPYAASVASCFYTADNPVFASCTSTGSTATYIDSGCAPDEMYAVTIDLQVNGVSTGKTAGGQSEDNSTVFLLSPTSSNYQVMVG